VKDAIEKIALNTMKTGFNCWEASNNALTGLQLTLLSSSKTENVFDIMLSSTFALPSIFIKNGFTYNSTTVHAFNVTLFFSLNPRILMCFLRKRNIGCTLLFIETS